MKLILALTGASGIKIGVRVAEKISENNQLYTIVSDSAKEVMDYELEGRGEILKKLEDISEKVFDEDEMGASLSSGSFKTDGMIIAPCSMKTLGAISSGVPRNLIERAADVTLKEKRKLVVVPRENPLNQIHMENMLKLSRAGAEIVPPVMAFYFKPESLEDMINHIVGKVLERFDLEHDLYREWSPEES